MAGTKKNFASTQRVNGTIYSEIPRRNQSMGSTMGFKPKLDYPFETDPFKLIVNQGKPNIQNYERREQQTEFNLILRNIHDKRKRHTGGFMATNLMNYEKNNLWGTGYYSKKNQYLGPRKKTAFPSLRTRSSFHKGKRGKSKDSKRKSQVKFTKFSDMAGLQYQ